MTLVTFVIIFFKPMRGAGCVYGLKEGLIFFHGISRLLKIYSWYTKGYIKGILALSIEIIFLTHTHTYSFSTNTHIYRGAAGYIYWEWFLKSLLLEHVRT